MVRLRMILTLIMAALGGAGWLAWAQQDLRQAVTLWVISLVIGLLVAASFKL